LHGLRFILLLLMMAGALAVAGCSSTDELPDDPRVDEVDQAVRDKWGKGINELPVVELRLLSANNENIQSEFEWAFNLHHALEYGQRVELIWLDVGGGSSSIEKYILNEFDFKPEGIGIDVLWGGGEFTFMKLASLGLLARLELDADTLDNVPSELSGIRLRDADNRWIGSAVSGFGFIYNQGILEMCEVAPPRQWEDLADDRMTDLIALADPIQSGSAAAAYRMIVVSEPTWPAGWAKLLGVLSNAKMFADSAGAAANAPVLGEAPVATAIDFYGAIRVAEAPDELTYVSPRGQTTFSPDPIGILKGAPNLELAQRFVQFVMSRRGQALWARRLDAPDGPFRKVLDRQPIRRDVYALYGEQFSPSVVNPYEAGQALEMAPGMAHPKLFGVLRQLVISAALDNVAPMRRARHRLNELKLAPDRQDDYRRLKEQFVELPDNIDSLSDLDAVAAGFKDDRQFREITIGWRNYFRQKFESIADAP
jgi:ABC-type Fe3+ transport system substrate-binding protein